jgi:iron-sulfur cluster repair protein YtfE (RIC family)
MNHKAALGASLREDHDALEELASKIIQMVVEGDREDVSNAVTAMEASILMHLEGEERELIPRYARENPVEAAAILREHAAIRKNLTELDVSTDLHLLRATALRALLESLRVHAKRENAGMYRWAEANTEPTTTEARP